MGRLATWISRLSIAVWLGSGLFLALVAAPSAFAGAGDRETAANIVGLMLAKWHWISVLAPLVTLVSVRLRRKWPIALVVSAVVLANVQWNVDNRIVEIRKDVSVSISEMDRDDPVRKRFGLLHGLSMMLMLGQVLGAAGVVWSEMENWDVKTERRSEPPSE